MSQIVAVPFHDEQLLAFERSGQILVALRPIAEAMGLAWGSQWNRIQRDPILASAVFMMKTPFGSHGQVETCLPLEFLNGWLFTIDHDRVRPELREGVLLFKRECYRVLFEHFYVRLRAENELEPVEAWGGDTDSIKLRKISEARLTFGSRAAQSLWLKLGLDTVPEMLEVARQPDLFLTNTTAADSGERMDG